MIDLQFLSSDNYNKNCNTIYTTAKRDTNALKKVGGIKNTLSTQFQKVGGFVPLSTLRSTPMIITITIAIKITTKITIIIAIAIALTITITVTITIPIIIINK